MAQDATAVCEDDFSFTVTLRAMCELEVQDVENPSKPGNDAIVHFFYRNGNGTHFASEWNIYLFNRTDSNADGTARTTGTRGTPSTGLPEAHTIDPTAPETEPKPNFTTQQRAAYMADGSVPDNVYLASGTTDNPDFASAWWVGSVKFTSPDADADTGNVDRIHAETTTFYGYIEMVP